MKRRPDLTEEARQRLVTLRFARVAVLLAGIVAFLLAHRFGVFK
jgi:hypothetical protein